MNTPPTFRSLSPTKRKLLLRTVAQAVRCDDKNLKPQHTKALGELEQAGLVHQVQTRKRGQAWKATDTGRGLVRATGLTPVLLHRQSQYGYTSDWHRAMSDEPEAFWRDAA